MEVRDLLSWVVLDMSGHVSENLTPKRLNPLVILTPLPHKLGVPSRPLDTSSKVNAPDDAKMVEASLEEIPTALHTCSFWGLQLHHFTWGLHLSSVDTPVDIHGWNHNFQVINPREALLVGHWVTALPLFSCGIHFGSPPIEVVLHGIRLVHLSCVWWLPIHKGMPPSDTMRRSQFWWRTHDLPCWFVT